MTRQLLGIVAPGQTGMTRVREAASLPRAAAHDVARARRLAADATGRHRARALWALQEKVPDATADSGSHRLTWILRLAESLGFEVSLYSLREERWHAVRKDGAQRPSLVFEPAGDRVGTPTVAWVAQPEAACALAPVLASVPGLRLVYDSVDVHSRRLAREADTTGSRGRRLQAGLVERLERSAVRSADVAVAVTEEEAGLLAQMGAREVAVVPNVHEPRADAPPPPASRSGLLFVGSFAHGPNVDAVRVLADEVLPRIWATHPHVELDVVGRAFPAHAFADLDARIRIRGWVADLDEAADRARVLVAPLRFGAGLKGKVGYALSRGLPVVTTTVGAEGFPDGRALAISGTRDWDGFAALVTEVLERDDVWAARSKAGIEVVRAHFSPDVVRPLLAAVLAA